MPRRQRRSRDVRDACPTSSQSKVARIRRQRVQCDRCGGDSQPGPGHRRGTKTPAKEILDQFAARAVGHHPRGQRRPGRSTRAGTGRGRGRVPGRRRRRRGRHGQRRGLGAGGSGDPAGRASGGNAQPLRQGPRACRWSCPRRSRVVVRRHRPRGGCRRGERQYFLNNSSLGVYPRIVELRDRYRGHGPASGSPPSGPRSRCFAAGRSRRPDPDGGRDGRPTHAVRLRRKQRVRMAACRPPPATR